MYRGIGPFTLGDQARHASARKRFRAPVGLFGGTFNPPHRGHLGAASAALKCLKLARVIFIPASCPPHKPGAELPPMSARLAMVRLAVRRNRRFFVSDVEMRRPGPSYTIDTLRHFTRKFPRRQLVFIMGADTVRDIRTWHRWREVMKLARFAVISRPGFKVRPLKGYEARFTLIRTRGVRASSRDLRSRLRRNAAGAPGLPSGVARYAKRLHLYSRFSETRRA